MHKISALPEWDEEGGSLKVLSCHERRKKKDTSVDLKRTVSDMETIHGAFGLCIKPFNPDAHYQDRQITDV